MFQLRLRLYRLSKAQVDVLGALLFFSGCCTFGETPPGFRNIQVSVGWRFSKHSRRLLWTPERHDFEGTTLLCAGVCLLPCCHVGEIQTTFQSSHGKQLGTTSYKSQGKEKAGEPCGAKPSRLRNGLPRRQRPRQTIHIGQRRRRHMAARATQGKRKGSQNVDQRQSANGWQELCLGSELGKTQLVIPKTRLANGEAKEQGRFSREVVFRPLKWNPQITTPTKIVIYHHQLSGNHLRSIRRVP